MGKYSPSWERKPTVDTTSNVNVATIQDTVTRFDLYDHGASYCMYAVKLLSILQQFDQRGISNMNIQSAKLSRVML